MCVELVSIVSFVSVDFVKEIEVQVLKAPKQIKSTTKSPAFVYDENGKIIGRIDKDGNIIATDESGNEWNEGDQEHGRNMWIIWWVLATIIVTLGGAIITFVMLRKKYFGPNSNNKNSNEKKQGIEMNSVNYHSVKKHTIKPTETNETQSEPGNQTEKEALQV